MKSLSSGHLHWGKLSTVTKQGTGDNLHAVNTIYFYIITGRIWAISLIESCDRSYRAIRGHTHGSDVTDNFLFLNDKQTANLFEYLPEFIPEWANKEITNA